MVCLPEVGLCLLKTLLFYLLSPLPCPTTTWWQLVPLCYNGQTFCLPLGLPSPHSTHRLRHPRAPAQPAASSLPHMRSGGLRCTAEAQAPPHPYRGGAPHSRLGVPSAGPACYHQRPPQGGGRCAWGPGLLPLCSRSWGRRRTRRPLFECSANVGTTDPRRPCPGRLLCGWGLATLESHRTVPNPQGLPLASLG